ncbi:PAS domain S-box-containing protein [Duganella sp. CF402]|uniref:ATP-binding protein n=1 Tax=unclassified Duganella TaxID=2636909 RepID=UPI0008CCB592|nr:MULTISPECIES: ATP-binding protein [unclassified Duganella]RZT11349.1 PAS domain S-box-containing protein [Duganella sp. BK701]SEK68926.1 PAS domain S-box-containing protein [Duganella sp. CF402]
MSAHAPTPTHLDAAHSEVALSEFFEGHPVATFAIDARHQVTHWNRACEHLLGWSKTEMIGTDHHWQAFYQRQRPVLADLIVNGQNAQLEQHYAGKYHASTLIPGAYEAEDFFPNLGAGGHWLHFTAAPLRDSAGRVVGAIETLRDVTERRVAENALRRAYDNLEHLVDKRTAQLADMNEQLQEDIRQRHQAEAELRRSNLELTELNDKLSRAQQQLVQADKLASIGQLAAGVAHEINNPVGYIFSNFSTLQGYLDQLFQMLDAYQQAEPALAEAAPAVAAALRAQREQIDLDYLRQDVPALMAESREGIVRVRHIVQDLKDFSRVDTNQEWVWANLHRGIDSTLNIVSNEVKYKADVVKEYGAIPDIQCLPLQINQVVMNLVVNAAHAIGEQRGRITVRTGTEGDGEVWFEVADTGSGIAPDTLARIFDPFFTTKAVGQGTGLGLSLAYGIVRKHGGRFEVDTAPGAGSRFRVRLPVRQDQSVAEAP